MRTRIGLGGTIAIAVLAMLAVATALGHAALESSDPPDGGTIKTPYTLTATFDEELTPNGSSIKVQAENGTEVGSGTVNDNDDKQMIIELSALPDGEYEVLWTAVTADDLGVTRGTYHFTASSEAATASTKPNASATVAATAAASSASPQPSSATGSTTGGGNDVLIALALAAVIIAGVVGFVLYRNRS